MKERGGGREERGGGTPVQIFWPRTAGGFEAASWNNKGQPVAPLNPEG